MLLYAPSPKCLQIEYEDSTALLHTVLLELNPFSCATVASSADF